MSKALKYFLFILGSLVLLLVAAIVLVAVFVDPNDYKDDLARLVKDKTGRELVFQGDIALTFFPWLGVEVGGVTLGNAPGFGDEPFVAVGRAQAGIQVLPLLSGKVEIGTVTLDQVRLNLAKDAKGRSNWDDLAGGGETAAKPEAKTETKAGKDAGDAGGLDLRLGGLEVKGADVVYDDRQAGKRYEIRNLGVTLGEVTPGEPFSFELTTTFDSKDPEAAGDVTLRGVAALDLEQQQYTVSGLNLALTAQGKAVPGGRAEITAQAGSLSADLKAQTASLDGLVLSAYGVQVHGAAQAAKLLDSPEARGVLDIPAFDLKKTLAALGQTAPETADPAALTRVA
ncbi:MAG: AsmA family protein, partial [Desulfovibrionaceae bacterium]